MDYRTLTILETDLATCFVAADYEENVYVGRVRISETEVATFAAGTLAELKRVFEALPMT